eukprot:EG_transcript_24052
MKFRHPDPFDPARVRSPGPGQYETAKSTLTLSTVRKGKSSNPHAAPKHPPAFSPGPGQYEVKSLLSTKGPVKMKPPVATPKVGPKPLEPGPGQYEPAKSYLSTRGVKIPKPPAKVPVRPITPGPGQYNHTGF